MEIDKLPPQKKVQLAGKLRKLQKTVEWELVRDSLERSILHAATTLGERSIMDPGEIDFRRGVIFAFNELSRMPEMIAARLESNASLAMAFYEDRSE